MVIMLTGGAGYIGSKLTTSLINDKNVEKVIVLDSFLFGPQSLLHLYGHEKLEVVLGDIRDADLLEQLVQKSDTVVHLAGLVGYPICDAKPWEAVQVNEDCTRTLSILCARYNRKLVFASTGSAYGKVDGICHEDLPIDPTSLYGRTKANGERQILDAGGTVLRLATLFGLSFRNRDDLLVNNFMKDAVLNGVITLFQGHAKRSFLHVDDAVSAFKHFIFIDGEKGVFNIGNNANDFTKSEIAQFISNVTGCVVLQNEYKVDPEFRDYPVSYEKCEKTGFKATMALEENLEALKQYYGILR